MKIEGDFLSAQQLEDNGINITGSEKGFELDAEIVTKLGLEKYYRCQPYRDNIEVSGFGKIIDDVLVVITEIGSTTLYIPLIENGVSDEIRMFLSHNEYWYRSNQARDYYNETEKYRYSLNLDNEDLNSFVRIHKDYMKKVEEAYANNFKLEVIQTTEDDEFYKSYKNDFKDEKFKGKNVMFGSTMERENLFWYNIDNVIYEIKL